MSRSEVLTGRDYRAILRLVGECRELGAGVDLWQRHLLRSLMSQTGSSVGLAGEQVQFHGENFRFAGTVDCGWSTDSDRSTFFKGVDHVLQQPGASLTLASYRQWSRRDHGVCISRPQIFNDRDWAVTWDYEAVLRPIRTGDVLWCFRSVPGHDDGASGVTLHRPVGAQSFRARDRELVRQTMAAVAPLAGGPLARYIDPSPTHLSSRVRDVLRCLLEGDTDKQIAARLHLSPHTVNQYTKTIYRHYNAHGRTQLMAHWLRRGWQLPPAAS